tara:strand:+ start:561 stop:824 length:264 start_codon:yes stop_codon:yes gene_type:complete
MFGSHLIAVHHAKAPIFNGDHMGVEQNGSHLTAIPHQRIQLLCAAPADQGKCRQTRCPLLADPFQVPQQRIAPSLLQLLHRRQLRLR